MLSRAELIRLRRQIDRRIRETLAVRRASVPEPRVEVPRSTEQPAP